MSTCHSATTLCFALLSPFLLYPQSAPDKEKSVFEGTVRDSVTKLPIAKASIHVIPVAANQPTDAGTSDATGAFRFEAIMPGDYRIQIRGRGYADAHAVAIEAGRTNTLHFTAGKAVTGAVIELDPEAVITGRVMDAEGEPVPSAVVLAIAEQWQRGVRIYRPVTDTLVNDRGEYRLKVLPGSYYLEAFPMHNAVLPSVVAAEPGLPEFRLGGVFYPNAPYVDSAAPVEVL